MDNLALLIVDMMKAFFQPTGNLKLPKNLSKVSQAVKTLLDECRSRNIPVAYVNDAFQQPEAPIDYHFKLWGIHAIKGDPKADVIDLLAPTERDFVIEKKIYDGFYNTRLDTILRELNVNTVIVTGTWTDACVIHTVMGAWAHRYQTIVPEEAVTAPDEDDHKRALAYMSKYYGTRVLGLSEALEIISNAKYASAQRR